jgi:lipid kinase YegS
MLPGPARTLRLVLNGKAAARPDVRAAVRLVREAGHRVDVRVTWEGGDAARFAEAGARGGAGSVVAGGGDGTLREVVQGVLRAGAPCAVGLVPLGTANDFAAACGLPLGDPAAALLLAATAPARPIDTGRVGREAFVNVATGGFGAEVTAGTPPERKELLGRAAYLVTGLRQVPGLRARALRVRAPGLDWEGRAFLVAVGNGRQAGGGFRVCPHARLDDGLLDVTVLPEVAPAALAAALAAMLAGRVPPPPTGTIYAQVPWVEVHAEHDLQFNLDGEPTHGRDFRFEAAPASLRFHLPDEEAAPSPR